MDGARTGAVGEGEEGGREEIELDCEFQFDWDNFYRDHDE